MLTEVQCSEDDDKQSALQHAQLLPRQPYGRGSSKAMCTYQTQLLSRGSCHASWQASIQHMKHTFVRHVHVVE